MSRKIDTTRTASIGEESQDDGMFNVVNGEDGPGTTSSLNNLNVLGLGPNSQNQTALNHSIRSDGIAQTRTNKFDMIAGNENERHDTITLSDEEETDPFGTSIGDKKKKRLTLT